MKANGTRQRPAGTASVASKGGRSAARERPFAVKGVFQYVWSYVKPRKRKVWYETRIVRVLARSERLAKSRAHRVFGGESFVARWPAPDVSSTAVRYVGIGGLLDIRAELEPNELWWELVDNCPRILERAR